MKAWRDGYVRKGGTMRRTLAIVTMCCALALAAALAGCGGSSGSASGSAASGETSSEAAARAEAEAKAAEAQAALEEGTGYWYGTGANGYNKEKARVAFQKAADNDSAEGYYWLGVYTSSGTSPDRFAQEADYYQKAIDAGCAKGYYGLGGLYQSGAGVEKDPAKAQELYQQAIDAGDLSGNIGLGSLYQKGEGVEASGAKAAEFYEKAVVSEDYTTRNKARCALGKLYRLGAEGLEADPAKAVEYYQAAADENYVNGWRGLDNMYTSNVHGGDFSIEEDYDKAFECASKEADGGYYINLGVKYESGHGCEQSYEKAIELYQKEVDEGREPTAGMVCLATMYMSGRGVEKDLDVATDWCNKALEAAAPDDDYAIDRANEHLEWIANHS